MRLAVALLVLFLCTHAAAAPTPPSFRLGELATPLGYEATLAIDPREPRFSGEVKIRMRLARAAPVVWLNATGLDIAAAEIVQAGKRVPVRVLPGGEDFVGLEGAFAAGEALATLRYTGALDQVGTRGLFRQRDRGEWYVVSQFEAISARRAFPSFDEPGWKTPWQLTIDAPSSEVVVSNTPELRAVPAPGRAGWTRHEFAPTAPLPTYLIALAVGPFDVVDGGTAGAKKTPLRYLAPKGRGVETRYAREVTPRLLELLEEYFGMPYPFEKLDSVTVPQTVGFGAMENVGMITYASSLLLATPREETEPFRRRYAGIGAHEIAHMWFGNLVTLAWWDDIWLNEAFASWMAELIATRFRPEWDNGWRVGWSRRAALELDRLAAARRVRNPVVEKTDLAGAFDSITYDKGSAVLAMFERWFGAERFRDGVRRFLARHAYGSATAADFIAALGEASGRGAEALAAFRGFIEQPGVPMISLSLECNSPEKALLVSQERLRPVGSEAPQVGWTIPVCVRHASGEQCSDIGGGTQRLALPACPAWVLGNAGGKSYYVPRYEASLARRLQEHAGALTANEIVSLSVDAEILSKSGLMSRDEALAWAEASLAHPSPVARAHAVRLLREVRDGWLGGDDASRKRRLVAGKVVPLASGLGWREREGESVEERDLRASLLPFAAEQDGGAALRDEARRLARAWLGNRDAVSALLTLPVLETAARFADAALYRELEALAVSSANLRERSQLLAALAKVREPALRSRALALSLDERVNGREAVTLLSQALDDEANRLAAFAFVRERYEPLVKRLPQHSMAWLISELGALCTPEERAAFAGFFGPRAGEFMGGALRYRQALEKIDICVAARRAAPGP